MKYKEGQTVMYKGEKCTITEVDSGILPPGEPFIYTLDNDQNKIALTKELSEIPPAPASSEDDKEYREWVEHTISDMDQDIADYKCRHDNELMQLEPRQWVLDEYSTEIRHLTRLIADIKKGVEQTANTWSDADMVEFAKHYNHQSENWLVSVAKPAVPFFLTAWQQQKKGGGKC